MGSVINLLAAISPGTEGIVKTDPDAFRENYHTLISGLVSPK